MVSRLKEAKFGADNKCGGLSLGQMAMMLPLINTRKLGFSLGLKMQSGADDANLLLILQIYQ